jgi:hypothetical protein
MARRTGAAGVSDEARTRFAHEGQESTPHEAPAAPALAFPQPRTVAITMAIASSVSSTKQNSAIERTTTLLAR